MNRQTNLNAICPYFTMFPLDFPLAILENHAKENQVVLDPFCGRGTTNYASRVLGLQSFGIDSSPVAVAISQAKTVNTTPEAILAAAENILQSGRYPTDIPTGEFWKWAYEERVLLSLCLLREELLRPHLSAAEKALRGIILGALHGPRKKSGDSSYFSNQSQRTYAPKPDYAVKFWKQKKLKPKNVDVIEIIKTRVDKYYANQELSYGKIIEGDSRNRSPFSRIQAKAQWVITSPPYYGMRTYLPDQWLRLWFLGGEAKVDYSNKGQVSHSGPETFANDLGKVWENVGDACSPNATLVARFGGINDRKADPLEIIKSSLKDTGWRITTIRSAGFADEGRRQANHINKSLKKSREEFDLWARWQP